MKSHIHTHTPELTNQRHLPKSRWIDYVESFLSRDAFEVDTYDLCNDAELAKQVMSVVVTVVDVATSKLLSGQASSPKEHS